MSSFDGPAEPEAAEPPGSAPPPETLAPVLPPIVAPPAAPPTPPGSAASRLPPPGPAYPVSVIVPHDPGQNRLWGIPLIGIWIRAILVIPQAIVLFVLALGVAVLLLVSWIPILFTGRQTGYLYDVVGGYFRLWARTGLYVALMTGRYPPFGPGGEAPISVTYDRREEQNRLWGIPVLGIWVRVILLIPHFIIIWVLGIGVGLIAWISWIPVLGNGRQSDAIVDYVSGVIRWSVRVGSYALLLTGTYPPFRLAE